MTRFRLLAACCPLAAVVLAVPAPTAIAVAAIDNQDPGRFIDTLSRDGLAALKGSRTAARTSFRAIVSRHFATDQIGDRLIRRWLPTITPAQRAAYKAALPAYLIGTYADRLYEYGNAQVKVVRTQPSAGGVDVVTQIIRPNRQPNAAVWSVVKAADGWKITNLRVAGINLAMAQAADFDSVVQRQGFDALVKMMQARGG